MRFILTLKYIYILFPFYSRGDDAFFVPFSYTDGPRETDIKSSDGYGFFSFFLLFFGTEYGDDEYWTQLFEHLPTRWLLCERHPTFQFDLMMVSMEIKC